MVGIRYGIKVGTFTLSPTDASLRYGDSIDYQLTWTHPRNWHDLETIHLRIVNDDGIVAWVRFDEASNTLSLLDPATRQFSLSDTPGSQVELETAAVSLDLAQSKVTGSGPLGRDVTIDLPLRFMPRLEQELGTGEFRVELMATDDYGNSQGFDQGGTLLLFGVSGDDGCGIVPEDTRTSTLVWVLLFPLALLLWRRTY